MLALFTEVIQGLMVYPNKMWENIESTRGLVFSQRVLLALVEMGLSRELAYELVQRNAMRSWDDGSDFRDLLKSDTEVTSYLSDSELSDLFDYGYYLRYVEDTFRRLGLVRQPIPAAQALVE